jgi:hypothetical protein
MVPPRMPVTPSDSSASTALGHRLRPAPMGVSSGALSWTTTGTPCRCRATAVASPPMPAPAMWMASVDMVITSVVWS